MIHFIHLLVPIVIHLQCFVVLQILYALSFKIDLKVDELAIFEAKIVSCKVFSASCLRIINLIINRKLLQIFPKNLRFNRKTTFLIHFNPCFEFFHKAVKVIDVPLYFLAKLHIILKVLDDLIVVKEVLAKVIHCLLVFFGAQIKGNGFLKLIRGTFEKQVCPLFLLLGVYCRLIKERIQSPMITHSNRLIMPYFMSPPVECFLNRFC